MQLHVDPNAATPIYRQIERQIAEAIADRRLRPGDELLPEEQMAAHLVVSPASVRKAYEHLEWSGLCRTSDSRVPLVLPPTSPPSSGNRAGLALSLLKRELLAAELESAREAQSRLLPPPRLEGEGWRAEVRSCPAGALSGDFYDLFRHADGGLGVVVADVAGKGLAAGVLMAAAKSMLPFVVPRLGPAAALRELNRRLRPLLGRREFIAMACARLSPGGTALELANAGLPDPYLIRAGVPTPLAPPGPRLPLGLRRELRYEAVAHELEPGDRLLFTSDGLAEATDERGDPLGYEALARLLSDLSRDGGGPAEPGPWLDELLTRVREVSSPLPEDDWTALLVERRRREGR